ncbi:MAG: DUF3102 domain-containing protein [Selenomonadaceae bacterium]|nr:DUF3102 domain-containing protein [Selenomonadaceae bacterium]
MNAKKEVGHGNWENWLKENFNLSDCSARQFMQIAERFSNQQTSAIFSQSQMVEMLLLSADDTEKFIEEKADDTAAQMPKIPALLTLPPISKALKSPNVNFKRKFLICKISSITKNLLRLSLLIMTKTKKRLMTLNLKLPN